MSNSREIILNKIKKALQQPVPLPFSSRNEEDAVYITHDERSNAKVFVEEFKKISGNIVRCSTEEDAAQQLLQLIQSKKLQKIYTVEPKLAETVGKIGLTTFDNLAACDVSITYCDYLVARTGTIVLSTTQKSGRTTSVYAPVHFCFAYTNQIVYDVEDALTNMAEQNGDNFPSFITFATGPSRTADIEKTLVTGVHGPKEVYCFLIGED
jgi:L-lactate dehydrogenase complex protein LldG